MDEINNEHTNNGIPNKTFICIDENNEVRAISDGFRITMEGCTTKEIDGYLNHDDIDGFIWKDNEVVFSEERFQRRQHENRQWELRNQREKECFSVADRGEIWHQTYVNTEERKQEFQEWYQAWLDVTETMIVPEKPSWIN